MCYRVGLKQLFQIKADFSINPVYMKSEGSQGQKSEATIRKLPSAKIVALCPFNRKLALDTAGALPQP